jgi:hypothetical protein
VEGSERAIVRFFFPQVFEVLLITNGSRSIRLHVSGSTVANCLAVNVAFFCCTFNE